MNEGEEMAPGVGLTERRERRSGGRLRPRAWRAAALCAGLLIVGASCATLSRQAFSPPVVTVQDVRLAGVGFDGGRIDLHLSMYNPNGYRLDASSIRYEVFVDTLRLANGTIDQQINLGKRDSASLRIPVNFGLRQVASATAMLAARGTLPFQLIGELRVLTPFGSVSRSFEQRGTYDGLNISILPRD